MNSPIKWLSRVLSMQERRRSERKFSPPLMAFYWDGGAPSPRLVPDISRSGMFLKTSDRWYPQTLLRVTLQKNPEDSSQSDEAITVQCRVVRADDDGIGVAFMLAEGPSRKDPMDTVRLATQKDLNRFIQGLVSDFHEMEDPEYPRLPFPEFEATDPEAQGENVSAASTPVDGESPHNSHLK